MSGADLIAFLLYALRMLQPLKQLSQMPTTAQSSLAAAERLFEILDSPSESADRYGHARTTRHSSSDIAFDDVTFAYGDAPVLSDISLRGAKGEVVALVGAERSGEDDARRSDSAILRPDVGPYPDRRRRHAARSRCRRCAR